MRDSGAGGTAWSGRLRSRSVAGDAAEEVGCWGRGRGGWLLGTRRRRPVAGDSADALSRLVLFGTLIDLA